MSRTTNPANEPSVTCGFFNSKNDRKYDANQMSSLFDGIINDGIFASIGGCFVVNANGSNIVHVNTGRAWFNHTWTYNDAILPIDCGVSEVLQDRIDAIVIEVNTLDTIRDNFIKIVKGIPSSSPSRPTLMNKDGVYQHALCYILRPAGSTGITQAEVTNMVGSNDTPFVTGPLEVISHEALLGQWQSQLDQFVAKESQDFNSWFDNLKSQLDGNVAANLQNQIDNLKQSVVNGKTSVANAINGHLGTTLSDQNTFNELASYIVNQLSEIGSGKLEFKDRNSDIVNGESDITYTFNDTTMLYGLTKVTPGRNGYISVKADKPGKIISLSSGEEIIDIEPGVSKAFKTENNSDMSIFGYCIVVCEEPATIEIETWYTLLNARPIA